MMTQLTIEIPDADAVYLKMMVTEGDCDSVSDLVRRLIQQHRERESFEEKVLAGMLAKDGDPMTPEFFDSLRKRIRESSSSAE